MNTAFAFALYHSLHDFRNWLARDSRPASSSRSQGTVRLHSLAPMQLRVLDRFFGGSVECVNGCVWLTFDGDCRDVVLQAGESHVADRNARLIVYALEPSAIRLQAPN
jgi:Protein of unknown function (DUF2917)